MELLFLGDLMFGWKIRDNMLKYGPGYPLGNMPIPLSAEGIVIGNLETVVSDSSLKAIRMKNDKIVSFTDCLKSLKLAGIKYVSLANNHIYDYGRVGLLDTLKNLKEHDIEYFGAGENISEANRSIAIHFKDISAGALARTFTCEAANPSFSADEPQAAELKRDELIKHVQSERSKYDILIVILHTGFEYCPYPDYKDVEYYRLLIDNGADLVIGHHPHVFQGIEKYKHGLIAYSLGNFVFDNTYEEYPDTSIGFILNVKIKKDDHRAFVDNYSILPVSISANGQVQPAQDELKDKIIQKVKELSEPLKLDIISYRKYSDSVNAGIILSVRKKEIIRKIKNLEFRYLLNKTKNIKLVHIRMLIKFIAKYMPVKRKKTN